ncbi:peptidoglycan-binding protein [Streptomyces sp. NPDC021749]|uniref:peptidoglycan-binding protein n=1 Tax=Streptomyces sp. NPDC021749 TaxID=3154905 RepID=UPI00340B68F8
MIGSAAHDAEGEAGRTNGTAGLGKGEAGLGKGEAGRTNGSAAHDPAGEAGRALAQLLRRWWEASARDGRPKPTQQSLAGRLGIDQTTLSRYLNPGHPSTAPLRTVELLHTVLRAPAADLPRARALSQQATITASARRTPRPRTAPDTSPEATPKATPDAPPLTTTPTAPHPPTPPRRAVARASARTALALLGVLALGTGIGLAWGTLAHRDDAPAASVHPTARATRWPLVRKGHLMWSARTVQYLLQAHGYDVRPDGDFGPGTAAAVKKFQSAHGLLPDGKVGDRTWSHLIIRVDSHNDTEPAVLALQYLLDNTGIPTDQTGLFTPSTVRSLEEFQRSHRLSPTGIADAPTWQALLTAQGPPVHR